MQTATSFLTIGDVAVRLGVREWQLRRLFNRGLAPEPTRVGPWRAIAEGDLPAIETALKEAGYLK